MAKAVTTAIALLGKRADPNIAEPDGTTPLHWAVRNNDVALVERLIRAAGRPLTAPGRALQRSRGEW